MGFVGKGGKEPMVYVSREGCVCRLSDFSKGRQGGYEVGSVEKGGSDTRKKTEKNRERKGKTNGDGLRSVRRTDRILSPTTLKLSGGLTDRLRCVGFWFEDETGICSTTEEQRWSAIGTVLRYRMYNPEEGSVRFMMDRNVGGK
ncbi:hypothetical protein F2Q70_00020695 [Brassica cretica]|uniref:Uncharacterized protein n=1 Tax=Brassica cretica TaxID=69181 RepID=A0A8S9GPD8_BRACR|nr:hypothetical protein F2Q70_00020695 [Brassica cretica]